MLDWHPFAMKFDLMEGDEWEAFKESIRESGGNKDPVIFRMKDGKKQGVDGRNREKACHELGLKVLMQEEILDDGEVKPFILRRNWHRRHMTKERRKKLVAELREDGHSTREIATALGVPKSTVALDAKEQDIEEVSLVSGAQYWAPETDTDAKPPSCESQENSETAEKVTGRDGKKYAKTKVKKPKTSEIRCDRCVRLKLPNPCIKCLELREAAKEKTEPTYDEEPAEVYVEREPGDDTEIEEAARAENRAAAKRNGKVIFDDRPFEKFYGGLIRFFDARANALGKCPAHQACIESMGPVMEAWKQWTR